MKRILPLLLILVLLLAACGAEAETEASPDPEPLLPPEDAPGAPDDHSAPKDGPDEDELPILTGDGEVDLPATSEETVTLDGLSSYLRVTLPEGWTWAQAGGTPEGTVYGLWPEDDPDFKVELHWWPENSFGMCGTGVTFQDYALPNGETATLATETNSGWLSWTLILPQSPDCFTIQFSVETAVYEAHRAELELLLGTVQHGVLAGLDVVNEDEPTA
jgi:hypothetical protein